MNVEKLVEELNREEYKNNMEKAAEKILCYLKIDTIPIPIIVIVREFGFIAVYQRYKKREMSGIIGIDMELKDTFGSDKIISVSLDDSVGHQRFTLAHELKHYIFDFDRSRIAPYYEAYNTSAVNDEKEKQANIFAANLLMPMEKFRMEYKKLENLSEYERANKLMDEFQVSPTAIRKRYVKASL